VETKAGQSWWSSANYWSGLPMAIVLVVLVPFRFMLVWLGLDHLSTVSSMATGTIALAVLFSAAMAVIALLSALGRPIDRRDRSWLSRLQRRNGPAWVCTGMALSAGVAAGMFFTFASAAGVAAQHTAGDSATLQGTITRVTTAGSPRNPCLEGAEISIADSRDGSFHICTRMVVKRPFGVVELVPSEAVAMTVRRTVFGAAIIGVQRSLPNE
jgi:hypothetical protein